MYIYSRNRTALRWDVLIRNRLPSPELLWLWHDASNTENYGNAFRCSSAFPFFVLLFSLHDVFQNWLIIHYTYFIRSIFEELLHFPTRSDFPFYIYFLSVLCSYVYSIIIDVNSDNKYQYINLSMLVAMVICYQLIHSGVASTVCEEAVCELVSLAKTRDYTCSYWI